MGRIVTDIWDKGLRLSKKNFGRVTVLNADFLKRRQLV